MDESLKAQALVLRLDQAELVALRSIARGESLPQLALALSMDEAAAEAVKKSMKSKIGAEHDADAVRVALYAGFGDFDKSV